jgi:hypothetical protein
LHDRIGAAPRTRDTLDSTAPEPVRWSSADDPAAGGESDPEALREQWQSNMTGSTGAAFEEIRDSWTWE